MYGNSNAESIAENLNLLHPDMAVAAIKFVYSEIYAEEKLLDKASTQLCMFAACLSINCFNQAKSQISSASTFGTPDKRVAETIELTLSLIGQAGANLDLPDPSVFEHFGVKT